MIDVKTIRKDFLIFQNNPDLVFLDNASTTQKPQSVIDTLSHYYENYNANIHRGIYQIAEKATAAYEKTRDNVKEFIGAKDRRSIVFTKGTTESINLVANSWGGENLKPGDEVLITEMEHHSNIIPWQLICKRTGANLKYIPINEDGSLDLSDPEKYFTINTKIVCVIHQSNVFGTINPIAEIVKLAHEVGALVLVDGAQSTPHHKVNVSELNCDFFAFSGHKMLGPTGVGVLYAKPELLEAMHPFLGGGEMIRKVTMEESTWNDIPWKFEAGTPNIAQVIGLGSAIDYINKIGRENITEYETELLKYAQEKLQSIPGINIYGTVKDKGAVFSFNVENIHPHDVAHILDTYGIAIRAGHHCAQPIMKKLNIAATNRASFYIYNTLGEIDQLVNGLIKTVELFN
ncbi:MAG: cysteine desulfurase [Candidatus Marinimicrobia bacterium]|nr:cysteine desulfurase [Candidatus Neomarinimicrobiota bacterium]